MNHNNKDSPHKISKLMEYKHRNSALIIAHRGGAKSLSLVENSIDAFQHAISQSIKMIEFDVRKTKDNQLVVYHNNHINQIKLNNLTYEELCALSMKNGYKVPLFEEVLKLCSGKIMLDIELKESGYEETVLSLLNQYFSTDTFVITSFLDSVIIKIKDLNPKIKVGLLIGKDQASLKCRLSELFPFKRLKRTRADFIVPNYRLVTPWLVRNSQKLKYHIYVWTVNGDNLYTKLISKRVSGIITDYPERYNGTYLID